MVTLPGATLVQPTHCAARGPQLYGDNRNSWIRSPCPRMPPSGHLVAREGGGCFWSTAHRAEQSRGSFKFIWTTRAKSNLAEETNQRAELDEENKEEQAKMASKPQQPHVFQIMFSRLRLEAKFNHSKLFVKACRSIWLGSWSFFPTCLSSLWLPFLVYLATLAPDIS